MALDASKTWNGSFGKLYHDGAWLTNVTSVEASVEINYEDVARSGTRWVGKKATTLSGSGTFSGYKIDHTFARKIAKIAEDGAGSFVTELLFKVDDPENTAGRLRIRLINVQFDTIPLLSFEHGSLVTEEIPFTFSGIDYLD